MTIEQNHQDSLGLPLNLPEELPSQFLESAAEALSETPPIVPHKKPSERLQKLMDQYGMFLADSRDSTEISMFFNSVLMKGKSLEINFIRDADFFAHPKSWAQKVFTFYHRDSNGRINLAGTIALHEAYWEGKRQVVGYFGDLRSQKDKSAALAWRGFGERLVCDISEIPDFMGCEVLYTVILDSNEKAKKALVVDQSSDYFFHPITTFSVVSLLLKRPFKPLSLSYQHVHYTSNMRNDVVNFIHRVSGAHPLGHVGFEQMIGKLGSEKLIVVKSGQQVVGCYLPFTPAPAKKIVVTKMPWFLKLFVRFMRFFGMDFPLENEEFKTLYPTCMVIDSELSKGAVSLIKADIIRNMWRITKAKGFHSLTFPFFKEFETEEKYWRRDWLAQEVSVTLYQIVPKANAGRAIDKPAFVPQFEIAIT